MLPRSDPDYLPLSTITKAWRLKKTKVLTACLRDCGFFSTGQMPSNVALDDGLAIQRDYRNFAWHTDKLARCFPLLSHSRPTPEYARAAKYATALIEIDREWQTGGGLASDDLDFEWCDVIRLAIREGVDWRMVQCSLSERRAPFRLVNELWEIEFPKNVLRGKVA